LLGLLAAFPVAGLAAEFPDEMGEPAMLPPTHADPEPWREQGWEIPPPPEDENLFEVQPMQHVPYFRFWVDGSSLSVGPDQAIRYVTVITAETGNSRNMRYEGLLCGGEQYRTYARGRSDGSWRVLRDSGWEPFHADPSDHLRLALKRFYFCKDGLGKPLPRDRIMQNLRRGGETTPEQGTRWFLD
jgi:hypothetical protein